MPLDRGGNPRANKLRALVLRQVRKGLCRNIGTDEQHNRKCPERDHPAAVSDHTTEPLHIKIAASSPRLGAAKSSHAVRLGSSAIACVPTRLGAQEVYARALLGYCEADSLSTG